MLMTVILFNISLTQCWRYSRLGRYLVIVTAVTILDQVSVICHMASWFVTLTSKFTDLCLDIVMLTVIVYITVLWNEYFLYLIASYTS